MDMFLEFNNVYLFSEIVKRNNVNDLYWPDKESICFNENEIINKKWHLGWHCQFFNKGLQLKIDSVLTEEQYLNRTKKNLLINKNMCQFYKKFSLNIQNYEVFFKIKSEFFEKVRKEFYISQLFGEQAEKMWSAEFFDPNNSDQAFFFLGFDREQTQQDKARIKILKNKAAEFR